MPTLDRAPGARAHPPRPRLSAFSRVPVRRPFCRTRPVTAGPERSLVILRDSVLRSRPLRSRAPVRFQFRRRSSPTRQAAKSTTPCRAPGFGDGAIGTGSGRGAWVRTTIEWAARGREGGYGGPRIAGRASCRGLSRAARRQKRRVSFRCGFVSMRRAGSGGGNRSSDTIGAWQAASRSASMAVRWVAPSETSTVQVPFGSSCRNEAPFEDRLLH